MTQETGIPYPVDRNATSLAVCRNSPTCLLCVLYRVESVEGWEWSEIATTVVMYSFFLTGWGLFYFDADLR